MRAQSGGGPSGADKNATFGQRRIDISGSSGKRGSSELRNSEDGGLEMSWVPSSSFGPMDEGDELVSRGVRSSKDNGRSRRKGIESFGAGMERGGEELGQLSENDRKGRTQRRKGIRSGSKNVFRRIDG